MMKPVFKILKSLANSRRKSFKEMRLIKAQLKDGLSVRLTNSFTKKFDEQIRKEFHVACHC